MLSISLYLAISVLILTPLSLLVARFISKKCNTYFASQAKARGELTDLSSDIISMRQIINDEEAGEADERINLSENDTLTFIRLTMLAGRMW